jgi:hypothetical protein
MKKDVLNTTSTEPWWKWVAGWLIPPFGLSLLFPKSRFGRLLKIPLVILVGLILIISVDTVLYPHRVEDVLVKKEIIGFLSENKNLSLGEFRKSERVGAFALKKRVYLVYRMLTRNGSYDFILLVKKEGTYKTEAIYQTYPNEEWVTAKTFPLPPRAMLVFYEHRTKFGELQKVWNEKGEIMARTTKGTYQLTLEKGQLTEVKNKSGKTEWEHEIQYELPKRAVAYFRKHEKELGKIDMVFGYDMDPEKEIYRLSTDKGWYRVDVYDDGTIKIFEAKPALNWP